MEVGEEHEYVPMPVSVDGLLRAIKNGSPHGLETKDGRELTKQEAIEYLEKLQSLGIKTLPQE